MARRFSPLRVPPLRPRADWMVVKVACVAVLDCTQRRDFVVIHVVMDRAMHAASESGNGSV